MPRLILSLLFIFTIATTAYAGWVGPETIVSGKWGSGDEEFGIEDTYIDQIPDGIAIDSEGNILVSDSVNNRAKLYTLNGQLITIINPVLTGLEGWPSKNIALLQDKNFLVDLGGGYYELYNYDGELIRAKKISETRFVSLINKRNFLLENYQAGEYNEYSSDFKLIKTYKTNPNAYNQDTAFESLFTSASGSIYGISSRENSNDKYVVADPEGDGVMIVPHYIVCKFDSGNVPTLCLDLPANKSRYLKTHGNIVRDDKRFADYGFPVIAPNGDVYIGEHRQDTYSVLKWAWVDDPIPGIDFTKPISSGAISSLDKKSLRLLRNTIFARHGRQFKSDDLNHYFSGKDWYEPVENYSNAMLSDIDKANLELILKFEAK